MAARYVLVSHFSIKLTYKEVSQRVKFLKRRYNFFKRIVESPGVIWDREQRTVHATKEQWSIFASEYDDLAEAYEVGEEPLFDKGMGIIFQSVSN
ncbi:hypothetical protein CASFOL_011306 [Castilleja foliolosa]|uniref:Myb/SANT-like domain-containing protein n=1 Tax=Castilleja foliolosa TaxID=1961234 RepID=A0ABD3DWH8_9LAMI